MQPRLPDTVVSGTLLVVVALFAHLWVSGTVPPRDGGAATLTPGHAVVTTGHGCPGGLVTCDPAEEVPWWLLAVALSPLVARRPSSARHPATVARPPSRRRPTPVTDAVVLLE